MTAFLFFLRLVDCRSSYSCCLVQTCKTHENCHIAHISVLGCQNSISVLLLVKSNKNYPQIQYVPRFPKQHAMKKVMDEYVKKS